MSYDTSGYVEDIPVKIYEKFRPPPRLILPAACNYQINPELFIQEYDFKVEEQTLKWIEDCRNKHEKATEERRQRLEEYDRQKAERKAREEEERLQKFKEEEERLEKLRVEEELRLQKLKEAEEERIQKLKELEELEEEKRNKLKEEESEEDESKNPELQSVKEDRNLTEDGHPVLSTSSSLEDNSSKEEQISTSESNIEPQNPINPAAENASTHPYGSYPTNPVGESGNIHPNQPTEQVPTNPYYAYPNPPNKEKQTLKSDMSGMLLPTQISSSPSGCVVSPVDRINFADFEGDVNDPFENTALKSINDLEELAQVLQPASINSKKTDSYNQYDRINPYYYQQNPDLVQTYPPYSHINTGNLPSNNLTTTTIPPSNMVTTTNSVPLNIATTAGPQNSRYNANLSNSYNNTYYQTQHPWPGAYANTPAGENPVYNTQSAKNPIYTNQSAENPIYTNQSIKNPLYNSQSGDSHAYNPYAYVNTNQHSLNPTNPLGQRPDLEDFYSKYYLNKKSVPNQNADPKSGEITPISNSLRSSRSVPDLTQADDPEISQLNQGKGLDGGFYDVQQTATPPRPSSTGLVGLEDWKPLPELPDSPSTKSSSYTKSNSSSRQSSPHSPHSRTKLPDPFAELDPDAQSLVQGVAEMGFQRPMVARAVQKLGKDHKKLIEVLLILQDLQDTGEDSYRTERAFYHYMGDLDKTKDHLVTSRQLLDLGFEEERVVDVLLKHNNNTDRALEELIT